MTFRCTRVVDGILFGHDIDDDEDREQELGRAWKLLEDPDGSPCAMVGELLVWLTDAHDAQLRGLR